MKTSSRLAWAGFVAVLVSTASGQNRTFTSQYSFGDSLSDSGNTYALTRGALPPSPPYFNGRYSSGPVFTELLGNPIVPAATVSAARRNLNFAFAGANAGPGGELPNLAQQIGMYRLQGLPATPTDLFTVLAGPNDLIATLTSPATPLNPSLLDTAGVSVARSVASGVQSLIGLGAKNIVVVGLPNLGATPRSMAAGGPGGPGATFGLRVSNAANNELRARLQELAAGASDVNLVYVDMQGIMERVLQDYRALGFGNASAPYIITGPGGAVTRAPGDPAEYVFWDDIHPTTRIHALIAAITLEELNPEPVLGFGSTIGTGALALRGQEINAVDARASQVAHSTRPVGRMDTFASFQYGDGVRASDGWRPKFGFDARVATAGVDCRASEGFLAGAALNVGRLDADVRGGRGGYDLQDVAGTIYGIWHGGPVSLTLDAGYGAIQVKGIRRTTAFGGLQTGGKTSGDHWGAGLKAAWGLQGGGFLARPWIALRTERMDLDPYAEHDVASLNFAFEGQKMRSNTGALGVDVSSQCKFAGRDLRLDYRAAWRGELGNRTRALTGRLLDNMSQPTTLSLEDGDGGGVELGGAVTLFLGRTWSGSLGYFGDIRSGEKLASRVLLSVQSGF